MFYGQLLKHTPGSTLGRYLSKVSGQPPTKNVLEKIRIYRTGLFSPLSSQTNQYKDPNGIFRSYT